MVKRMCGVAGLLTAMALSGSSGNANAQCVGCAVGCVSSCPGLSNCVAGGSPVAPMCATWGPCECVTEAEGGSGDPINPRRPRPMAAAANRGLTIYHLIWELRGAGRAPLETELVVRGFPAIPSPDEVQSAVSGALGGSPVRLRLADGGVFVGARSIEGAFATRDGDGFALDARRDGPAVEIAACRVTGRALAGPITHETLQPGEALLIPVLLNGRAHIMALIPSGISRASWFPAM